MSSRYKKGSEHKDAKLTEEKVRQLRKEFKPFKSPLGLKAYADKYGVNMSALSQAIRGETWKHVK